MLCMTRKNGEIVVITTADGTQIRIRSEFRNGDYKRVRLSFDAPPDVVIDRLEVHEKKHAEAK